MTTRSELIEAMGVRYRSGTKEEKARILDEFTALAGYHRKHAMRLLRRGVGQGRGGPRPLRRRYGESVRMRLLELWEVADRICGKRLRPVLPTLIEAMERHGHLQLSAEDRAALLTMSAATLDRIISELRSAAGEPRRRRRSSSSALKRSVPIRTFADWDDPPPGFMEADLVLHSGASAKGSYLQTLVATDIATGWTECLPLLIREQTLVVSVISELRRRLPFPLLGIDTDNDSVFINETLRDYCATSGIVFTRCRPYRKNDQAWIEQKNGAVVRRLVGYRRYEGTKLAAVLSDLYAAGRLFVNFFQPSFKLAEKHRDGARVRKRYHAPATPFQRLLDDSRTSEPCREQLRRIFLSLDPVQLLHDIRVLQERLAGLADAPSPSERDPESPAIDEFLENLRTAWKARDARATDGPKVVSKRGRRRPDPLLDVTAQLRAWFDAEPHRTSREFLERLQKENPGQFPNGLLRTVQRRIQIWRAEQAIGFVTSLADYPHDGPRDPDAIEAPDQVATI